LTTRPARIVDSIANVGQDNLATPRLRPTCPAGQVFGLAVSVGAVTFLM
jgi:hypothetical protein